MKMAILAILCLPTGDARSSRQWRSAYFRAPSPRSNKAGPHGFSEILYAYTSTAANNGSAFGGLSGNTPWYNITLGYLAC